MLHLLAVCLSLLVFEGNLQAQQTRVKTDTLTLFDSTRQRPILVVIYTPSVANSRDKPKLAIINHGYGGKNTAYLFIASALVRLGYIVASIQHEIPGDEPIATTGNLRETRRPNWERGVQNIRFVVQALQRSNPSLDSRQLLLVGHSNGGDMAMLFAQTYPRQVSKVISLDNRRMPIPRTKTPRVLSIRSSDQVADPGVLPTASEQKQLGITVVQLPISHNDMWDGATREQKRAMTEAITRFLRQ